MRLNWKKRCLWKKRVFKMLKKLRNKNRYVRCKNPSFKCYMMVSIVFQNWVKLEAVTLAVFHERDVLKNFAKFIGKHLCQSFFWFRTCNFIDKETSIQVFSCEFWEILQNTFFMNTSRRLFLENITCLV